MSTFILGAEGAMRKIVHMHRSTIVELEDDQSCADEGGRYAIANAHADAPDLYAPIVPSALKVPRPQRGLWLSLLWPVGVVALIGLAAVLWP